MKATEVVVSESPFVVRREARWSDCDPAGVVYTGRYTDYVLGAIALYSEYLGDGVRLGDAYGVGTPCKAMSLEFIGTLWPGDVIEIECRVGEIRTRSYDIHLFARRTGGEPVFKAVFSPICVQQHERISTPIPEPLRQVLVQHSANNSIRLY